MNLRVFLDANVLFTAAHNPDGLSNLLFELRRLRVLLLVSSHHAIEEAQTNLQVKFPTATAEFQRLVELLEIVETPANSPVNPETAGGRPSDLFGRASQRIYSFIDGRQEALRPLFRQAQPDDRHSDPNSSPIFRRSVLA